MDKKEDLVEINPLPEKIVEKIVYVKKPISERQRQALKKTNIIRSIKAKEKREKLASYDDMKTKYEDIKNQFDILKQEKEQYYTGYTSMQKHLQDLKRSQELKNSIPPPIEDDIGGLEGLTQRIRSAHKREQSFEIPSVFQKYKM